MSHLDTAGGDDTEKPIDVEVPLLAIEDDVKPPTLDDHEISVPDTDQDDHPKHAKPVELVEMLAAQLKDF